ncbi:hypothetical protein, partial [Klebsiella pneumoniae]|uniref:hypothetical protein n=1 Tax=Klebsiella pneumoniae TaxID=573 RepID=UPI001D0E44F1
LKACVLPENTTRYGETYPKSDLFNKAAYCLKIQPATGSFARNLIYSTKPFCFATERSALSGRCVIGSFNSAKVRFIQQSH